MVNDTRKSTSSHCPPSSPLPSHCTTSSPHPSYHLPLSVLKTCPVPLIPSPSLPLQAASVWHQCFVVGDSPSPIGPQSHDLHMTCHVHPPTHPYCLVLKLRLLKGCILLCQLLLELLRNTLLSFPLLIQLLILLIQLLILLIQLLILLIQLLIRLIQLLILQFFLVWRGR